MSSLTGSLETRKDCKTNGLGGRKHQNNTKPMVWEPGGLKTLQKQWFGSLEVSKPYKNNGLGAWRPQNLTKTMVWEPPGFQTPPFGGGTANPEPWIIYMYIYPKAQQSCVPATAPRAKVIHKSIKKPTRKWYKIAHKMSQKRGSERC